MRRIAVSLVCVLLLSACQAAPARTAEETRRDKLRAAGKQLASTCPPARNASPVQEASNENDNPVNKPLEEDLRTAGFVLAKVELVHERPDKKLWVFASHPECLTVQYEDPNYFGAFKFERIYLGTGEQHRSKVPNPPLELDLECIPNGQLGGYGGIVGVLETFRKFILSVRSGTANYEVGGLKCFDSQ